MQKDIETIIKEVIEKEIGEQIRTVRILKGKSRPEVAKAVGLSTNQIRNYEDGRHRISVSRLKQIADFLKVDILELLPESIRGSVKKN